MFGKIFFYVISIALFVIIFIKMMRKNEALSLVSLILQAIGIGINFIALIFKIDLNLFFIILSGVSTGLSWLFYFQALKKGEASIVFPIEKLSAAVAILISVIFLKERLDRKGKLGFCMIIGGTLLLIFVR